MNLDTFHDAMRSLPLVAILRGIAPESMAAWRQAGAAGLGIGSAPYRPGKSAAAVREDAARFAAAHAALA